MHDAIFIFFSALIVASVLFVSFSPNIVYSAFTLLVTLASVAAYYVFLGSDFLAGVQLLVYVGGILVLILFAIMLTEGIESAKITNPSRNVIIPLALSLVLLFIMLHVVWHSHWPVEIAKISPITSSLGKNLLQRYILPFELISILLLVGLIGAVSIARLSQSKKGPEKS